MSELVNVETQNAISTFRSSGGYETAVIDFLEKHPDNSTGSVTIRKEKRTWYKYNDTIVVMKDEEEKEEKNDGILTAGYPVCPDCGLNLDRTAIRCACRVCGKIVTIEKRGEQFFTTID